MINETAVANKQITNARLAIFNNSLNRRGVKSSVKPNIEKVD